MEKQVLDTFPKLIEEYTDIIKQSAIVLKEKQILVDRETRRIRVPPLDSDITLFGVPVQPLLTAYHGIEGVENDEALSGWDDLALAIADNESHSTVGRLARVVFPTYGFPSDSIATGTQFLGLCARAGVGRLYGDGETEVGVKRKTMFIGFTRRAVYFSRMRNLYGKSGPYRADAKGARGLIKADFTTAYTLEQSPILIRPSLAGIRALLLEAYPDERPGLDIVLGAISASNYRGLTDSPPLKKEKLVNPYDQGKIVNPYAQGKVTNPYHKEPKARVAQPKVVENEVSVWEKNLIDSFNVEEVEGAPELYDEWELLRRLVRNSKYDATSDIYGALRDIPYYEFVKLFGVPMMSGQVPIYSDKLRRKHLASIEKLAERIAMDRGGPDITQTLEVQSLISRLV